MCQGDALSAITFLLSSLTQRLGKSGNGVNASSGGVDDGCAHTNTTKAIKSVLKIDPGVIE